MRLFTSIFLLFILSSCKKENDVSIILPLDETTEQLPINKIQIIGSHNSYRRLTDHDILGFLKTLGGFLPDEYSPKSWEYDHKPLPYQLDLGLRSFELDIYYDPLGGRYYNRLGNILVNKSIASGVESLLYPGMKIMHIPDIDYNTNYYTFKDAISSLKEWSQNHPAHLPIFVLVELKTTGVGDFIPIFTEILPFTKEALDSVDMEIEDVFGGSNIVYTPDDMRGTYPDLKTRIHEVGWESVKALRGKIIFITYRNDNYLAGAPLLEGRKMFQFSNISSPNAAFVIIDNPSDVEDIQTAIAEGCIVRTRSDANTTEARTGDYTMRDAAFASGAQLISTDYYEPSYNEGKKGWTDYRVSFENNHYARTNIVNATTAKGKLIRE